MDPKIQECVDRLLLEQGEYLPLELLLAAGRLAYREYEAWRGGEHEALDERLLGDRAEIARDLSAAAAYAQALGLAALPLSYTRWGASERLTASRDPVLSELLHAGYRKPEDRPQLDLFMDSASASLANGIALALGRRDTGEASRLVESLYRTDPSHPRLGGLGRLAGAAAALDAPVADLAAEMAVLELELLPLAEDLIGTGSRNFLVPLWRRLHDSLSGHSFDAARPKLHQSYTASRMLDWEKVVLAVELAADWRQQPVLLQRHLCACEHLRHPREALPDLFELCWRFPEHVAEVVEHCAADIRSAWNRFLELDPELQIPSFPAWVSIIRPAWTNWLPHPEASQPEAYRLVHRLQGQQTDRQSASAENVRLRGKLKALSPSLFAHYIGNL